MPTTSPCPNMPPDPALATLIDAYLKVSQEFHAMGADDIVTVYHPGLPDGKLVPNWSHVQALHEDGLISLSEGRQGGTWSINISSRVLDDIRDEEANVASEPSGERRVEDLKNTQVFHNYFFGGTQNVAVASSGF